MALLCSLGSCSVQAWEKKKPPEKKASLEVSGNGGGKGTGEKERERRRREGMGGSHPREEAIPCRPRD